MNSKKIDWEEIKQSRPLMFGALYLPIQLLTAALFSIINLFIPSSIWCETTKTDSVIDALSKIECGANQWIFLLQCSVAVSVLIGLYGFLYPNRVATAFKNARSEEDS